MTEIRVLVLVHDRYDQTEQLLQSLDSHNAFTDDRLKVHILDNGSTDERIAQLFRGYPEIKATRSDVNLGVAGGRQWQLDHLEPCQYFLFLDSDVVIVDDRWIDALLGYFEGHENVGIAGPGGAFVDFDNPALFTPAIEGGQCDVVAGFCQMCRYELIAAGVKFDMASSPRWHEDSDFCLNAFELGFDVWCTAGVGLIHVPGESGDKPGLREAHAALLTDKWKSKEVTCAQKAWA